MTDARSNIGRELGPLCGLLFAIAGPVLLPLALVLGSPRAIEASVWGRNVGVAAIVLVALVFFVRQSINWTRKGRASGESPLRRLQDWDETPAPAQPSADDYNRWRGTLVDRISICLNPPLSKRTRRLLGSLGWLIYLIWAGLLLGLIVPGLFRGAVDPYSPPIYGPWLGLVAVMSGLMIVVSLWRWASRTRRELSIRAAN